MEPDGFNWPTFRRSSNVGDGDEIGKCDFQEVQVTVNVFKRK
jgi:hypothetical protein